MRKGLVLCGVMVSAILLCGKAQASANDPAPGAEEQSKARISAPYWVLFFKAMQPLPGDDADTVTPPYDDKALAPARAERERQLALCEPGAQAFKTQAAYVDCRAAADRAFAAAIALKGVKLVNAFIIAMGAAAGDADAGKLTPDQARDIYTVLTKVYDDYLGILFSYYDRQTETRLAGEYKDRFIAAYERAHKDAPAPAGRPPFDEETEAANIDARNAAYKQCRNPADAAAKKNYIDCLLGVEKLFLISIQWRDMTLYAAFETAAAAAVADVEAGRLSPAQFDAVFNALDQAFSDRSNRQISDYHALLARPIAIGYATRFDAAYVASAGWPPDYKEMWFDPSKADEAARQENEAKDKCRETHDPALTEAVYRECFIAAYRAHAVAIKLRDTVLLEGFLAANRSVAADFDAGHLNRWQSDAAYNMLARAFNNIVQDGNNRYFAKLYRPLINQYLLRVDNDYITSTGDYRDFTAQDFDAGASVQAAADYDRALQSCFDRRAALKTQVAYWQCRADAETELAETIHLRNMPIQEKFQAAIHQAAIDADAGKITTEQFNAATYILYIDFDPFNSLAWRNWRRKNADAAP